jgi:hypothetical protein
MNIILECSPIIPNLWNVLSTMVHPTKNNDFKTHHEILTIGMVVNEHHFFLLLLPSLKHHLFDNSIIIDSWGWNSSNSCAQIPILTNFVQGVIQNKTNTYLNTFYSYQVGPSRLLEYKADFWMVWGRCIYLRFNKIGSKI